VLTPPCGRKHIFRREGGFFYFFFGVENVPPPRVQGGGGGGRDPWIPKALQFLPWSPEPKQLLCLGEQGQESRFWLSGAAEALLFCRGTREPCSF